MYYKLYYNFRKLGDPYIDPSHRLRRQREREREGNGSLNSRILTQKET